MRPSHKLLDHSLLDEFDSCPKLNGSKTSTKLLSKSIVPM
jgi:Zn-finger nucleic acid-binding protein